MAILKMPGPMRSYVDDQRELIVKGKTVAEALKSLVAQFPALEPYITNQRGELRPFVNIFLGGINIRELKGLATPVGEEDEISMLLSAAGG